MEGMGGNLQTDRESDPEFNRYASSYTELLRDPLRSQFSRDPLYFHRRKWLLIQRILKQVGMIPKKLKWLDIGCGHGELLELAGNGFSEAAGCDFSAAMLPPKSSFKTYKQPSLARLPFADGSYDLVTVVCVLHHVHGGDRNLLADEIRRVVSPGGICCMIEHNPWNPVTRKIVNRCPVDTDAELLTARELSRLIRASGFCLLRTEYFLYLPERIFHRFGAIERLLSRVPFGGQYALVGQAPL